MSWTATFSLSQADAHAIADALELEPDFASLAMDAIETGPGAWKLTVYFPKRPSTKAQKALNQLASRATGAPKTLKLKKLPDADWVAKSLEGLPPVRVGRFVIHGGHDREAVRTNEFGIEIEAAQAFGTGHHGTTAGCLAAIERLSRRRRIQCALDIGTGSGVLAVAVAKALKAPVLASDIDPVAVRIAADNIRLNGVGPLVRTLWADGIADHRFAAAGPYDLIVANILARPLIGLAPAIRRLAAPGGTIVLSGLLASQRSRVAASYRAQGLILTGAEVREGWMTLAYQVP